MQRSSSTTCRTSFLTASLALALATSACSTAYVPQRNGKVAMTMEGGQIGYERNGRFHSHGIFGGGLVDAVRGVPAAESAAKTHQSRTVWGFVATVGGFVCSSTALVYAVENSNRSESQSNNAGLVSLGCIAATALGLGLVISAVPYRFDAINIFNDSVQPVGPVHMPGQAPPMTQRPPGTY